MLTLYSALCAYIGIRLFGFTSFFLPHVKIPVFWLPYVLLCYSFILVYILRLGRLSILRQISEYWIAAFVYLLLPLALFDIVRLVFFLYNKNTFSPGFYITGIGAAIVLCTIIIVTGSFHARSVKTVNYQLSINKQGKDLRIALISDIHISPTVNRRWIARIVDIINNAQPDIVFIAGDIFEGDLDAVKDMPDIITELKRINAPLGVYACLGNHDVDRKIVFKGGTNERIVDTLRQANIAVLEDEVLTIGENIYLAGRRDPHPIGMKSSRLPIKELLKNLDRSRTIIVLEHQPTEFPKAEEAGADLILCGHTHAGQFFPGNLFTQNIFKRAGAAHYGHWQGKTMQAVVTSGAGIWGPPVRVASNSEVAIIDIGFVPVS